MKWLIASISVALAVVALAVDGPLAIVLAIAAIAAAAAYEQRR